ncbi:hypothetical protein BD779DRAFT_1542593 [Infundibulicybe gibba]|nr:hypothetical protein BD779DRAFT_1542593 [Infundibulicybe gibba]
MIDTWIVRSKELPLYLELDFDSPDSYPVLEALIPHSYRWEYVNFSLEPDSLAVLARVRARLHSLKRLNLFFGGVTGTVDFCEVAPRLTEIKLAGNYEPAVIKLPWEQLRVCTVDNSGVALYVLQHAKDLQTFHLDMNGGSDFDAPWLPMPRGPHAHHPGLETLIIEGTPDMAFFFSSITLPSLRTLEVSFGDIDSDDDSDEEDAKDRSELVPIISTFLERSSKHLTTLILTNIPFPPNGLIKCLAIVPSLVSLDIQFDQQDVINDKLLHALNVNLPGYILPRLRSLSLRGPGMFSEERLDAVVTSRRDIRPTNDEVALLENLTLECSIPLGQSTRRLPRIHRFVCGGLNITYGAGWSIYNSIQTDRSESDLGERA